jgi:excisionase family DNA binding protein
MNCHFTELSAPTSPISPDWASQNELAERPFSLKEASEYLGVSTVTLRRWIKSGKLSGYKIGRAYSFDVLDLKKFKKTFTTGHYQF